MLGADTAGLDVSRPFLLVNQTNNLIYFKSKQQNTMSKKTTMMIALVDMP